MEYPIEFIDMVKTDIKRIDEILLKDDTDENWSLFFELDGRYQACIRDWYKGLWQSNKEGTVLYFSLLKQYPNQVKENLQKIKAKLETFQFQANAIDVSGSQSTEVNVTTTVNVQMTFDNVRNAIESMNALNQKQTDEIIEKINELEAISKEKISSKKKWEKVKPVINFAMDKGVDVAIAILSLVLQMNLSA